MGRIAQKVVRGQLSWRVASSDVEAYVSVLGGQMGPVTFERGDRNIRPYSVAPWAEEPSAKALPPILRALRGDFFCLPFGGNATPYRGERHPVHGETANARWRFESCETRAGRTCLHVSLATKLRPGRVDKRIFLRAGHQVVYMQHTLTGLRGPMNPGHHAMLTFPDEPGSGRVSVSRFVHGQVYPGIMERPEAGGYSCLKAGALFTSLARVPTADGRTADLSRYPARRGFEDLVLLAADERLPFAWTAVAFPRERYVWFALKNPRILRETIFWISNGGRHYPPWNGRHVNVMGLEEVTSYFHEGLAPSARRNSLSARGLSTCLQLDPRKPLVIPYVMGVARIPAGFDRVASIDAVAGRPAVRISSDSGRQALAAVDLSFLDAAPGW